MFAKPLNSFYRDHFEIKTEKKKLKKTIQFQQKKKSSRETNTTEKASSPLFKMSSQGRQPVQARPVALKANGCPGTSAVLQGASNWRAGSREATAVICP